MAKQLVTIIDSSGREFQSRRTWAESKRERGECSLDAAGVYHFLLHSQHNGGASHEAPQGQAARMTFRIELRPNEPTPVSNGDFLPYPFPRARSGASLRLRYPTLARAGAGLG